MFLIPTLNSTICNNGKSHRKNAIDAGNYRCFIGMRAWNRFFMLQL